MECLLESSGFCFTMFYLFFERYKPRRKQSHFYRRRSGAAVLQPCCTATSSDDIWTGLQAARYNAAHWWNHFDTWWGAWLSMFWFRMVSDQWIKLRNQQLHMKDMNAFLAKSLLPSLPQKICHGSSLSCWFSGSRRSSSAQTSAAFGLVGKQAGCDSLLSAAIRGICGVVIRWQNLIVHR